MSPIKLHADDLILFFHIVDAGSFTRASELTGLPKSTLSRRLSKMEDAFGERLIQRSTRRLVLTEFGQQMLEHARLLSDQAQEASALALHRQGRPYGILRVSLPPEYHELSMVQVIDKFTRLYPDVRLHLDLSSRRVDLVGERFDLAVRAATRLPDDASLVARHVTTLHNGLFASPAYLDRCGVPEAPADLGKHVGLIMLTGAGEPQAWHLNRGNERWEGMPLHVISSNSMGLQQALAVKGLGIAGLSERFARPLVEQQAIVRILPGWSLPQVTIWCVTPGRRLLPQRTSAFIETLKSVLQ